MPHTPGPWKMACDSYGKVQHSRKYDCVYTTIKGDGGDILYTVAARIENSKDALLIESAPELLAALIDMVSGYEDTMKRYGHGAGNADAARAIILKATGK